MVSNDLNNLYPFFSGFAETMERIREMTRPIAEALSKFNDILRPITETIEKNKVRWAEAVNGLSEIAKYSNAVHKLADVQFIYWDSISTELRNEINESDNTNKTLREYFEKNKYQLLKETVAKTQSNPKMKKYSRLYNQSVEAFWQGMSDLCVNGLTSVFDGLLSDISNNPTPSLKSRIGTITAKLDNDEILDNFEYATLTLAITFEKTMETFSANSDFSKKEPKDLNRHWIAHGRSHRRKTKLDCVKMINIIYGLLLIDELDSIVMPENNYVG